MSKELEAFTSSSLRGQKRGIYQQLLASLLVKTVKTNDPLEKIQALCEAAFTCRIKDKLDMDLIDVCFEVCQSFRNSKMIRLHGYNVAYVGWSFVVDKEENYERYVKPWRKGTLTYRPILTEFARKCFSGYYDISPENNKIVDEKLHTLPIHVQFYFMTTALDPSAFRKLQGEFTTWALKQLLQIQSILSDEIDPKVWSEALGQKGEPEEKASDENPLD
jgi:hypothetical protein